MLPVSTPFSVVADLGFPSIEYTGTLTPLGMVAERGTREAAGDTVLEGGIGNFDFGGGGADICNKPTLEFG